MGANLIIVFACCKLGSMGAEALIAVSKTVPKSTEKTKAHDALNIAVRIMVPLVVGLPFVLTQAGSVIQSFLEGKVGNSTLANFATVGIVATITGVASFVAKNIHLGKKTRLK